VRGDQLARQWRLIQRLARSRAGVGLDDLAHDLECTRRTVYRDLDALQYAGFPVTSDKRDGRVFYRLVESYDLGDAPFTADELLALAFAGDLLQSLEGTVFHDSVGSALAKVQAGLGSDGRAFLTRLRESFRVLPGPHKRYRELGDVIRTLNEAVLERRGVTMRYRTGRTGRVAARRLDPYRVWYRSGGLYAIGHDHRSGEVRTFAVDRIEEAALTGERFTIPDDFDFDARTASAFGVVAEAPASVRIRFERRHALYVTEHTWHPTQRFRKLRGGAIELQMEVAAGDELRGWILSFGAGAQVLEPEALRDELTAELDRTRALYP
jgi:predicted DNA-binding transcriptional regulator YafY